MQKSTLIESIAVRNKIPKKTVETVINAFLDEIKTSLIEGGKVQLMDFGTFSIKTRAAHNGRNPRTGESVQVPESKRVHFTNGKAFKEALNALRR